MLMRFLIREHLDISVGFLEALVWMPLCAFLVFFDVSTKLIVEKSAVSPACIACPACLACPA